MRKQTRRNAGTFYDPNELLNKTRLRTDEAAFLLDVAPRTVERYMKSGALAFIRTPSGMRRPLTESVMKFLSSSPGGGTEDLDDRD